MENKVLLTDEQMREFITQGFLVLKTDFPPEFHENLTEQMNQVYAEEGNPGNNLLPRIRELQKVFEHPVITGALTSVLGPEYMLHAHRHGHYNANATPGGWHKDSYWGYKKMRHHHPWWAMVMYFPQDTPKELGPTGVMPGTQNLDTRIFSEDNRPEEALVSGEAGTFALIHYDIWHRSTSNILGQPRYMLKFEFMRTSLPTSPTWDNQDPVWREPALLNSPFAKHDTMWEETWHWLRGQIGSLADSKTADEAEIRKLTEGLTDAYEPHALNAAYELARCGQQGIEALCQALEHQEMAVSRRAAYGLSIAGVQAVNGLIAALQSERAETVAHAVFALGELGPLAEQSVNGLNQLLDHPSEGVRRSVVESLGMIGGPVDQAVSGLIRCLKDQDVQVRFMAGLSLARLGTKAKAAVPELAKALDDENRYVRAHASEALRYIGTEEAKDVLIRFLFNSRWCPSTTKKSAFYP